MLAFTCSYIGDDGGRELVLKKYIRVYQGKILGA